jgi:hypothetical protein
LEGVTKVAQVDQRAREAFALNGAEWLLIEDLIGFTLPDFKGGADSPGRRPTQRRTDERANAQQEPELTRYCETFLRVLHAAYGQDKPVGAVIYSEPDQQRLPVRIISVFLNLPEIATVRTEKMESTTLQERLTTLYRTMLSTEEDRHKFYQRTARTYETVPSASGQVAIQINLIKPDQVRYWTRSMALRDADAVAADMMTWSSNANLAKARNEEAAVA